jgi:hypothetical protein
MLHILFLVDFREVTLGRTLADDRNPIRVLGANLLSLLEALLYT